ncbi:methyl-accepting chemotaxis protein [Methylobacterium sp. ap11]|uniref:hypothetical protein n=1 Tax=Methylobacterium sp. ap11 TaxID=1761799 RepID=UPI0008AD22DB|nr:hypothetical protein [Methylobacterium sp. ap11]SEP49883.1 methyl-accepting chemotaxis protein [Methylobacterium sp. ap11]
MDLTGRVSGEIGRVASGAEALSVSVGEISQQVGSAARMAAEAVAQARHTGAVVEGLSDLAARIGGSAPVTVSAARCEQVTLGRGLMPRVITIIRKRRGM